MFFQNNPFVLNALTALLVLIGIVIIHRRNKCATKFIHKMKFLGRWYYKKSKSIQTIYKGIEEKNGIVWIKVFYPEGKRIIRIRMPDKAVIDIEPEQELSVRQYQIMGKGLFFYLDEGEVCEITSIQQESFFLDTMRQINHFMVYAKAVCVLLAFVLPVSVKFGLLHLAFLCLIAVLDGLNAPFSPSQISEICEVEVVGQPTLEQNEMPLDLPEEYSEFSDAEKKLYALAQKYKNRVAQESIVEVKEEPCKESMDNTPPSVPPHESEKDFADKQREPEKLPLNSPQASEQEQNKQAMRNPCLSGSRKQQQAAETTPADKKKRVDIEVLEKDPRPEVVSSDLAETTSVSLNRQPEKPQKHTNGNSIFDI